MTTSLRLTQLLDQSLSSVNLTFISKTIYFVLEEKIYYPPCIILSHNNAFNCSKNNDIVRHSTKRKCIAYLTNPQEI